LSASHFDSKQIAWLPYQQWTSEVLTYREPFPKQVFIGGRPTVRKCPA
jgi:hypothetical protein